MYLIEKRTCRVCNKEFLCYDIKNYICKSCLQERIPCKCGCGKLVSKLGTQYAIGCKTRGKTYLEIYGTKNNNVGFRKGEENVSKKEEVKEKYGKHFYELIFSVSTRTSRLRCPKNATSQIKIKCHWSVSRPDRWKMQFLNQQWIRPKSSHYGI